MDLTFTVGEVDLLILACERQILRYAIAIGTAANGEAIREMHELTNWYQDIIGKLQELKK